MSKSTLEQIKAQGYVTSGDWNWLIARCEQLEAALDAIYDYEPKMDYETPEEVQVVEDCPWCAAWRAKEHPFQTRCEEHVRQHYRYADENKRRWNSMGWELKSMAGDALARQP